MSSSDNVQFTSISNPFAPVYWGFVISLLFGGITIVQAYIYFLQGRDRFIVRLMAAAMLVLDFVDSALVAYSIYYYLIPQFGSVTRLSIVTPELAAECLIATTITTISQLYFVYQLAAAKRLGKGNWTVIGVISTLCILSLAGGIACFVTMYLFRHGVIENRNHSFEIAFGVSKGFGAATDILATIAMCLFLNSVRTGMTRTNSILDSLVQLIINRGALVTLAQTLLLITFYAAPSNLAWVAFHINVPKLYANTFFAMLNGRDRLKEKHFATSVKLESSGVRLGDKSNGLSFGEHSTFVGNETQNDKDTIRSNGIMMKTVVTTSVI
ncbi:hypothetical protein BDQ12DRAFT_739141 [Crucibulum laeve]|uniref:DUF6534 domain-containing protein n=1 Tax=Crucibulum laeve TaxID=68775 RepID=A0A5C3LI94_9AGAR|nr:hypothetical protein BDQ12DRAFT_739141 [Crucibulum laeve]